jgi:hypothetical protein
MQLSDKTGILKMCSEMEGMVGETIQLSKYFRVTLPVNIWEDKTAEHNSSFVKMTKEEVYDMYKIEKVGMSKREAIAYWNFIWDCTPSGRKSIQEQIRADAIGRVI